MADNEVKIKFTTEADLAAADKATASVKNLGQAADKSAAPIKKLTDHKRSLREVAQGLSASLGRVGSVFGALISPMSAAVVAIGYLIQKNIELRREYKEFEEQGRRTFDEWFSKATAAINNHIQAQVQLQQSLKQTGVAARSMRRDLDDALALQSVDEQAQMDELAAKEEGAIATAEGKYAGDPEGLLKARHAIGLEYGGQRRALRRKFEDDRLKAKESTLAAMAEREGPLAERVKQLAAGLGAEPTVDAGMQEYDKQISDLRKQADEAYKAGKIKEYVGYFETAEKMQYQRPEAQRAMVDKWERWIGGKGEADAARKELEQLINERKALELQLDRDRAALALRRPVDERVAGLQTGTANTRFATEQNDLRRQASDRAAQDRNQQIDTAVTQALQGGAGKYRGENAALTRALVELLDQWRGDYPALVRRVDQVTAELRQVKARELNSR